MLVKTSCLDVSTWMGRGGVRDRVTSRAAPGTEAATGWFQVSPHQRTCPCSRLVPPAKGTEGLSVPPPTPGCSLSLCYLLR